MKAKSRKVIHVLGVCGAGTVTSTMLAMRVEEVLQEEGIRCRIDEIRPTQVLSTLETAPVDMIITSSPIPDEDKITVPVIKGHSLLSGFGEAETIEEIRSVATKIIQDYEAKNA
ncbi:MAG: galactitol system component [Chloroflexota bacterium]|nr:galactitol system component [Chloroflexota bacterium]